MPNTVEIEAPEGKEISSFTVNDDHAMVQFSKIDKRPMSWQDFCNSQGSTWNEASCRFRGNASEEIFSMYQLRLLRDAWLDGWKPDFRSSNNKYCILFDEDNLHVHDIYRTGFFLTFETKGDAELFLEKFRDIIETAKPYLGG